MKIVGNWRIENAYDIVIRAQDSIQADDLVSLKISNSNSNSNSNRVLQIVDEGSDDSVGSHKYNTYFNRMMTQTIQTSIHKNYEQSIDMSQLNDLNEKLLMLGEEKGDLMQSIRQHSRENMKLKEQLGQLRSMREQYV